jgi:hypothetical protein
MATRRPRNPDRTPMQKADEYIAERFGFLVDDFGYTALDPIPVTSPDVDVRGYVNDAARRRIEVSGSPLYNSLYGLIRQVSDGQPAPYSNRDSFLPFWHVALVRAPEQCDNINHNRAGWQNAVDGVAQLLRTNPDLLDGTGWISRDAIREACRRHMGFELIETGKLADVKRAFAFLLDLGYMVAYDSDSLTPHEYNARPRLQYEKGTDTIVVERTGDWYQDAWTLEWNGEPWQGSFTSADLGIHGALVARELVNRR